jgi:hypothetical protein
MVGQVPIMVNALGVLFFECLLPDFVHPAAPGRKPVIALVMDLVLVELSGHPKLALRRVITTLMKQVAG